MSLLGLPQYTPDVGDGTQGTSLPADGLFVPAGLEAVLEFNGLLLNVQKNMDRYKVTSIDGLGDSDIRDTRDVNTDSDGETPYNSFLGGRSIVITGTIETYSIKKMRAMQQALRGAFADVSREYPLYFRLGDFLRDHKIYCKKVASIAMTEQQQTNLIKRDFQISLRASNPRFLSYYQNFFAIAPPVSISSPWLLGTLTHRGNYWSEPIYRVYGPSSSTTITNDTTGASFTVTDVPFDDYFEYNLAKRTLRDSRGNNRWNNLRDDSQPVPLLGIELDAPFNTGAGQNAMFFQGDSPRIEISWYDSWV